MLLASPLRPPLCLPLSPTPQKQKLRKDGLLFSVRGFAAKLAEQAGRIAGGRSRFEDPETHLVGVDRTEGAIVLAQYYAAEALRLFGSAQINVDTMAAEDLRLWLARQRVRRLLISGASLVAAHFTRALKSLVMIFERLVSWRE